MRTHKGQEMFHKYIHTDIQLRCRHTVVSVHAEDTLGYRHCDSPTHMRAHTHTHTCRAEPSTLPPCGAEPQQAASLRGVEEDTNDIGVY